MASLIPVYNYDIFISYRQKDNKGDRWVSTFVEALKTELEATFKEDVSVYFDENPHDRLQETHNVDKSLEGKLKCLIFIPIISQTYCDPNSYAWQYEFLVFLRMTENDRFGKDVKLRSGNVASRILPIRIHDLEQEDIKLFEKETGSVLRAMDFVFKTASGVSRPLLSNEDHPNDNLNKTFYRDQINKVAHAIKEIILGIKTEPVQVVKEKTHYKEPSVEIKKEDDGMKGQEKPIKLPKKKLQSVSIIIAVLFVIAAILAYPKIFKRDTLEKRRSSGERISVAVMPFQNMTNDTVKWDVYQLIIQNNLSSYLSNFSKNLQVRQTESVNDLLKSKGITNYASITPSFASIVSQKLEVDIFIYGNIIKLGNIMRLSAQLIDTKTEEIIKPFQIEGPSSEENLLDKIDSLSGMLKDFLIVSRIREEVSPEIDIRPYEYTNNPEAYRYFISSFDANSQMDPPTVIKLLKEAERIDSNFFVATLFISIQYGQMMGMYEDAKEWCLKAYKKRDQMPIKEKIMTDWVYARTFGTPDEEIKCLKQYPLYDDQVPVCYWQIGNAYLNLFQYSNAISEYERALDIYNKWDIKPMFVANYTPLGYAYHKMGMYKKEKKLYKKAEQDFPDHPDLIYRQAILALSEGKVKAANEYIEKYKYILRDNSASEAAITSNLAGIYSEAGILDKAEEYYREALTLQRSAGRLNTLAYFLIDYDRDINAGLELVDEALGLSPDNYNYLDTKGWGLYKQGKHQEALDILQKSWDLRREKAVYNYEAFLHLEEAKKAVASQK